MDSEMGLLGKTVLVVGTGISGIAAVNLLATQSANIILHSRKEGFPCVILLRKSNSV